MTDGAGPPNAESPAVSRDRVVDPLTGLPVLRYRGAIAPTLRPGAPTPAGAWRLLRADRSGPTWVVDLETAGTATPFSDAPEQADDVAIAAVLETLADAARLGVVHGALAAERLWRRGDRVWVEGYGVGWRTDASLADDARDLAGSLLALPGTSISPGLRRRLTAIAERGDVNAVAEPSAEEAASGDAGATDEGKASPSDEADPGSAAVDASSSRHAVDAEPTTTPPDVPAPRSDAEVDSDAGFDSDAAVDAPAEATTAVTDVDADPLDHPRVEPVRSENARPDVPPLPPATDRPPRDASKTPPAFVKAPPPGATVRSGEDPWSPIRRRSAAVVAQATATPAGRRRAGLLVLLVAGVALLAALILLTQRRPLPATAGTAATTYVVNVRVEPAGLPPVRLVVLERPPGSRHEVGTVVGSAPGPVPLDREGTWRFEGQFLDRRSAPAVLDLPLDRSLVLVFPDPTAP